jgi:hypothetical protein
MITTTTVLIAVAKLELTPAMPTFAKIEVSAAKIADSKANMNHIKIPSFILPNHGNQIFHLYDYTPNSPVCHSSSVLT